MKKKRLTPGNATRDDYRRACREYPNLDNWGYCLKAHTYCETQQPMTCRRVCHYNDYQHGIR